MKFRTNGSLSARSALVAIGVLWCALGRADYTTPQRAGFHHCALVYDRDRRGADDLAPYVAHYREGKPVAWLFDAFLFLMQRTGSGRSTTNGEALMEDWGYQLDQWFGVGRDIEALDQAISRAEEKLGAPPDKRKVILAVPRPGLAISEFGDVDGDGTTEGLATAEDREAAFAWYVTEAAQRFRKGDYRHVDLWGFYWMHETIPSSDEELVREACRVAHARNYRMLWIPWHRAAGWERWRQSGIDVAIMQPNYAFVSKHNGRIRRNRLAVNAALCRENGLGVEIELPMALGDPMAPSLFRHYLADGADSRAGYQAGATAYYLGRDNVERLSRSSDPRLRSLYEDLARYVRGDTIEEPEATLTWTVDSRSRTAPSVPSTTVVPVSGEAVLALPRAAHVGLLDVFLDEPPGTDSWQGLVTVEGRAAGETRWEPRGWLLRAGRNVRDGRHQVATVPVNGLVSELRVRFHPKTARAAAAVTGLTPALGRDLENLVRHRAYRLPYSIHPPPRAHYPDSGEELTDGVVPKQGFSSGGTVGWHGGQASVRFDLGRPRPVEAVTITLQGGGYAAVNWPSSAVCLVADQRHPANRLAGMGAPPAGLKWFAPGPLEVIRRRSPNDADGRLTFDLDSAGKTQYIGLCFTTSGWLMLSEVDIFSSNDNISRGSHYTLSPSPSPVIDDQDKYADDGVRLTDGMLATRFVRDQVSGWCDDTVRTITVLLPQAMPVREVAVWSLRHHAYGVYDPASPGVNLSLEPRGWWTPSANPEMTGPANGGDVGPVCHRFRIQRRDPVDRVRLSVRRAKPSGWVMVSEIEIK